VDLLLNKGIMDRHFLHKVSHSFLKVVPSERTSIATRVAIVDNTKILGIQFAKKMGMFVSKVQKSM
jgi:hypothetical protein